jgi:hypothetical protein
MTDRITIKGDHISIRDLEIVDHDAAQVIKPKVGDQREDLVRRALRIGTLAIRDAAVDMNVDLVQKQFEHLMTQFDERNELAVETVESALRGAFGDDEGKLPQTMEQFLGEKGQLRTFMNDLFDENRRDSAISRFSDKLGHYFDGEGAVLATMLDPTRRGSPLYAFRKEMQDGLKELAQQMKAQEAARDARSQERARGTAKGGDFETVVETVLADAAMSSGDALEATGTIQGDSIRSKCGDFVLTLDPGFTRGACVRVVVEAKNRSMTLANLASELDQAKANRDAAVGLAVYSRNAAPAGVAPLTVFRNHVFCVLDEDGSDPTALLVALRVARILALGRAGTSAAMIAAEEVLESINLIRDRIARIRGMKTKLTSITKVANEVAEELDDMRSGIERSLVDAERALVSVEGLPEAVGA